MENSAQDFTFSQKRCKTYLESILSKKVFLCFYEQHPFHMFFQTNKWICSTQLSHNLFPSVELFTEIISSISYGLLQSVRPGFHDLTISFPLLMALKTYLRSFSITTVTGCIRSE